MKLTFHSLALLFALLLPASACGRELPAPSTEAGIVASLSGAIAGLCPTVCHPLQTNGLGQFPWFYRNPNQIFNDDTLQFISARVQAGKPGAGASLSAGGGFIDAYVQVIATLTYALGSADQAHVAATAAAAAAAADAAVAAYVAAFGPVTPADLASARAACGAQAIENSLDFVVSYLLGSVWSGRGAQGLQPLTSAAMTAAGAQLRQLLPSTPARGDAVVAAAGAYLAATQATSAVWSRVQEASWMLKRLVENTAYPDAADGGMVTVNPRTGAVSAAYQPGYTIARPLADISRDLNDPSRVLRITVSDTDATGAQTDYIVEFSGYTYIPIVPAMWQAGTGAGWYAGAPIAEAAANGGADVTGYKFAIAPAYNMNGLANGGDFGRLTGILICNDIRATPVAPGAAGAGSTGSNSNAGGNGSGAAFLRKLTSIAFGGQEETAAAVPLSVPALQQRAYVIAGTLAFPAP